MKLAVCLPDTQDDTPNIPIKLTRVGVTGVKKLLQLERTNKRPIILLPTFDAFVDLPSDQKNFNDYRFHVHERVTCNQKQNPRNGSAKSKSRRLQN